MVIERTTREVIFKLPGNTKLDYLQDISDFIEFKGIVKKSKATQQQVDKLVKTIKIGRWNKTKNTLGL